MILDTRIIDSVTFLNFEKVRTGEIVGKLIRLSPSAQDESLLQVSGTYTEYRTPPCRTLGSAELHAHTLLQRLEEEQGGGQKQKEDF
ncbi:hypothetical protein J31TS4_24380 [Paenibacillus sp. J31TS4]|uniref:hypothetical protein n=1 Tax=Paenibacillus sp. J31TS4 TaxID=2807195 RepID=UPI001B28D681|nr:hypothetical protein [Paenibacillus sp. J31TS4]GIP39158.1 hypothetical protein J31TS4_24380 [Paenibacillus sp. J31TS4]